MDEKHMQQILYASVSMTTEELTDMQLNVICMVAQLGGDPTHVSGYEIAKPLFTEDNEKKMHRDVLNMLVAIRNKRLGL